MRLTCPNCSARYEVDDGMIPAAGRDVQCSNCSTSWFQPGRRVAEERRTDAPAPPPAAVDPPPPPSDSGAAPEEPPPPATEAPRRRVLDPEVQSILREEAERETRLRRGPPEPVETQGEMPLPEGQTEDRRARRMAELEERAEDAFAAGAGVSAGPRRQLLPDIEEINSSLRAAGDRLEKAAITDEEMRASPARRRSRVRSGFFLVILLAALLTALYANADRVIALVPSAGPAIEQVVSVIDKGRFWLDDLARLLADGSEG